jgi:Zn-dependent M28 family amino/carboxypeptidase
LIFLWPTAEERGLLGAKYYVQHPLDPLAKTVANINLDYFSNWGWGRTKDFSILGMGMSSLDDLAKEAVARQGRLVTGDTILSRVSIGDRTTWSSRWVVCRQWRRVRGSIS